MRACRTCGVEKELSGFTVRSSGRVEFDCKQCRARLPLTPEQLERKRLRERARAQRPEMKEKTRLYWQTEAGKATKRRSQAKRCQIKRKANNAVTKAVSMGKLVRMPCEKCGDPMTHGHHDDYNKPLDVRWLCDRHHKEWHKHNTPICPENKVSQAGSGANNTGTLAARRAEALAIPGE